MINDFNKKKIKSKQVFFSYNYHDTIYHEHKKSYLHVTLSINDKAYIKSSGKFNSDVFDAETRWIVLLRSKESSVIVAIDCENLSLSNRTRNCYTFV